MDARDERKCSTGQDMYLCCFQVKLEMAVRIFGCFDAPQTATGVRRFLVKAMFPLLDVQGADSWPQGWASDA
jgi:hypothetical protein